MMNWDVDNLPELLGDGVGSATRVTIGPCILGCLQQGISKSWKVRYNLVIGALSLQGVIMCYNPL